MAKSDPPASADAGPAAQAYEVRDPSNAARQGREAASETLSGLPLPELFTAADVEGLELAASVGLPGAFPFTRGIHPTMYRGQLWTMRQYAGYASAAVSNARYRYLLSQGQSGLSVAFDLPTQIGYDPDHRLAEGEVGRVGVSVACLDDMAVLFEGIPLDRVSTSMTINATAPILLAMYVALAAQRDLPRGQLRGTIQNDVLKEYIARGTYIFPPGESLRLITDTIVWCARNLPRWNPISISGYHIREAGATAVQEIAFTFANAIAYASAACARGLAPDDFMPRLSFFFAAQNDLIEEVAKFRAARQLWAHIARDRFGARDPRSQMLRFHTQTAGVTLTAQQPQNNVVRVTLQALAAVLGGTQSLHTNAMDEALALPTESSATVALRTQQILAYESGVADIVDPLAGSYAVESLTARLADEAASLIERIDEMGGALAAIESGWVQSEVAESAYRYQRAVDSGERIVVGVNRFADRQASTRQADVLRIDPAVAAERVRDLARYRARRDETKLCRSLDGLRAAVHGCDNVVPSLVDAVACGATIGEICDVLRSELGQHTGATDA